MNVLVRADASSFMGLGHVVRCSALALELLRSGHRVCFYTNARNLSLLQNVHNAGGVVISPAEVPLSRALEILDSNVHWFVFDQYDPDLQLVANLRRHGARIARIHDSYDAAAQHLDVLINPSISPDANTVIDSTVFVLGGTKFALVRNEFNGPARESSHDVRRLLVTFGGSDVAGLIPVVVPKVLSTFPKLEVLVLVGPATDTVIPEMESPRLHVVRDPLHVADLMRSCDMAITAAGGTVWELACVGLPMIAVAVAENQKPVVQTLRVNAAAHVWDANESTDRLIELTRELIESATRRADLSCAARHLIDGLGTQRVRELFSVVASEQISSDDFILRPAARFDAWEIWRIASDPNVRNNSFSTQAFSFADHLTWYERVLLNPQQDLWVAEVAGAVAGYLRLDYDDNEDQPAVISFATAPLFRGKRLGTALLNAAIRVAGAKGFRSVKGTVILGNEASAKAFMAAGYSSSGDEIVNGKSCRHFVAETAVGLA